MKNNVYFRRPVVLHLALFYLYFISRGKRVPKVIYSSVLILQRIKAVCLSLLYWICEKYGGICKNYYEFPSGLFRYIHIAIQFIQFLFTQNSYIINDVFLILKCILISLFHCAQNRTYLIISFIKIPRFTYIFLLLFPSNDRAMVRQINARGIELRGHDFNSAAVMICDVFVS